MDLHGYPFADSRENARFAVSKAEAFEASARHREGGGTSRTAHAGVRAGLAIFAGHSHLADAANHKGLTCLDGVWHGWVERYRWRCAQGHVFEASARSVLHDHRRDAVCPECAHARRLQRLRATVEAAGATCLDTEWRGAAAYYRFRCSEGHAWRRTGSAALTTPGCPSCAIHRRNVGKRLIDGLDRLRAAARTHGGECLAHDGTYTGIAAMYPFRCQQGHHWQATGNAVLSGKWCRRCANADNARRQLDERGLQRLRGVAARHGGECLSGRYLGRSIKHRFRCSEGHEWDAVAGSVLGGSWCPECRYLKARLGIGVAQQLAAERGGRCLTECYVRSDIKMHWLCHQGHDWWTTFDTVRAGSWCPTCANVARVTTARSSARHKYVPKR